MIQLAFAAAILLQSEELRKVHRLMQESEDDLNARRLAPSEEKQREAIERLKRLIDGARAGERLRQNDRRADRDARRERGDGAKKPHPPSRRDPAGVFQSKDARDTWKLHLPHSVREAILHAARDIDEYPEPWRAVLRRWSVGMAKP